MSIKVRITLVIAAVAITFLGAYLDQEIILKVLHSNQPIIGVIAYGAFGWEHPGSWLIGIGGIFFLGAFVPEKSK